MKNITEQYQEVAGMPVLFDTEKFMQNTKLRRPEDAGKEETGMKEFNPDDCLGYTGSAGVLR